MAGYFICDLCGDILISLIITQQNNRTTAPLQEENPINAQSAYSQPFSPSINTISLPAALVKSGITVIKTPGKEPKNRVPPVQPEKSITTATDASPKYSPSNTNPHGDTQTGITKIGKYPTPKEAKEMNSAGVVMY